ncbi:hypothetical protein PVBG_04755 [Plasmodium vivax Brazil I]|uniref:Uncharacterized protein n=1 Tax=Plasmodium vivax (strain Brazil I) TaxID=1033975 RepID=A0A0J9T0I7_PLAV1|nr:hypothetical protein PVBG_04755 [Plasmodium vivax Brazil I]
MIYPFLDTVREAYEDFDKPIRKDDINKSIYFSVCHQIISGLNGDTENHKPYCMKLIRNLGHYYIDTDYFDPTFERCNILYNWIYHSSKKEGIPDNIIEKCFDDYNFQINRIRNTYKCSYDLYKNVVLDKMKLNILNLFDYNSNILKKTLMGTDVSNKNRCRNFLCECLKIYKHMNKSYCIIQGEQREKHSNICLELNKFNSAYKLFYGNLLGINPKIPSLDDINNEDFPRCLVEEAKLESGVGLAEGRVQGEGLEPQSEGTSHVAEQSDNGTSLNTSTVLSSMVGIPPFLALIYKVKIFLLKIQTTFNRNT